MLPSLSRLSLVSTGGKHEEQSAKRQKTDNRVELSVTESVDRVVLESGAVLNVACVSAAEMTVAKVVLDALIPKREAEDIQELPFYKRLFRGYKAHLRKIFVAMGMFEKKLRENATDDAVDIKKCIEIIDLLRPSTVSPLTGKREQDAGVQDVSARYRQFLLQYADERGLSIAQLLRMDDKRGDAGGDEYDRYGGVYSVGINTVLAEYFSPTYHYATSEPFTHVLRAFATSPKNGRPVCVGLVMMTLEDHHTGLVNGPEYGDGDRRPIRIQGIVGCSIFKYFYHAPVGNALLAYVQTVARREGNVVAADPLKDNEAWEKKLRAAANVVVGKRCSRPS